MIVIDKYDVEDLGTRIHTIVESYKKRQSCSMRAAAKAVNMSANNLYRIMGERNKSLDYELVIKLEQAFIDPKDFPKNWDKEESLIIYMWEKGASPTNPLKNPKR